MKKVTTVSLILAVGVLVVGSAVLSITAATDNSQDQPAVQVDSDKCVGCGVCAKIAPYTFRINPDTGKAKVINPPGDSPEKINKACEKCPYGAITGPCGSCSS